MSNPLQETRHLGGPTPTTRWTLINALRAGEDHKRRALEELCLTYWAPVYAFVRRKGRRPQDAEDLAQEFLVSMIESGSFERVQAEKGRLRSFLFQALQNFLAVDHRNQNRIKRGGRFVHVSIERDLDSRGMDTAVPECVTPDAAFDEQWASCLLGRAVERLADLYRREGKPEHFDVLFPMTGGLGGHASFAEAGEALGLSEGAARVAAFRLRKRLRQHVREEVAATLPDGAELEAELRHLFAALGTHGRANPFEPPSNPEHDGDGL